MPRGVRSPVQDPSFLLAALEGLEAQKKRIEDQIRHVQGLLIRRRTPRPAAARAAKKAAKAAKPAGKRTLSAAARKRIAAAQKRRWAEFRKRKTGAAG